MTVAVVRTRAMAAGRTVGSTTVAAVAAVTSALLLAAVLAIPVPAAAADALTLGRAGTFSVLANTAVDNSGATVLHEDLGLSPGTSVTGTPIVVNGATHLTDTAAADAQTDLGTAYADAAALTGTDIGAALTTQTLVPGVYKASAVLGMSGVLTLDAQGDPTAQFVFQVGTALTVDAATQILMINRAQACNVFWQVGSAASVGAGASFKGAIMAMAAVGLGAGAALEGRAMSEGANVVLSGNTITAPSCDLTVLPTDPTTATVPPTDPTTATDPATDPTTATDPATDPTTATDPATDPTTAVSTATSPVLITSTSLGTAPAGQSAPGAGNDRRTGVGVAGGGGAGGAGAGGAQAGRSAGARAGAQSAALAATGLSPMLRWLLVLGALLPVLGAALLFWVRRSGVRAAEPPEATLAHTDRRWRCR